MTRYPLYIMDLDGTLYRGSEAIPGAAETVSELRRRGSEVRFLTNNSSQTPDFQSDKLARMGIVAKPEEILTSGVGAAIYLCEQGYRKAFVVGEPGLISVLAERGISTASPEDAADAVVVGICRTLTYELLDQAMQQIVRGAKFIATNTDATYPMEGDRLVPGAGSIVAAVRTCTGVEPELIGKPNPTLVEITLRLAGIKAKEAIVVGDRYETDIVSGQRAGCDTMLVLTGVTKQAPPGQASAESLLELLA